MDGPIDCHHHVVVDHQVCHPESRQRNPPPVTARIDVNHFRKISAGLKAYLHGIQFEPFLF
jgi:hypothetical protein